MVGKLCPHPGGAMRTTISLSLGSSPIFFGMAMGRDVLRAPRACPPRPPPSLSRRG
ncbi:MAG: hypothetical protein MZV64_71305 [Ignavibacteriales bacterium]|nr:hypothetical protein [Ignavibacteriales bacterium]